MHEDWKSCVLCGEQFTKSKNRSWADWDRQRYCSVQCSNRSMMSTYTKPSSEDLAWLAGLLEGEGHFTIHGSSHTSRWPRPKLTLGMTDEDIVIRAAQLMGTNKYSIRSEPRRRDFFRVTVTGERCAQVMRDILPYMGQRRAQKIMTILADWDGRDQKAA